jgi:twinkle protein
MKTEYAVQCPSCASKGDDRKGDNLKYFLNDSGRLTNKCVKCGYRHNNSNNKGDTMSNTQTNNKSNAQITDHYNTTSNNTLITNGYYTDETFRGISPETGKKYLIQNGELNGRPIRIYNYTNKNGSINAQKIRFLDEKDFFWKANSGDKLLFGANTVRDFTGTVYISEGEEDCASIGEVGLYSLSIFSGAGDQTQREIEQHLDFLNKFEKIVFVFDNDEVGQKTLDKIVRLFKPGKALKVVLKKFKDANEYLKAGLRDELLEELNSPIMCLPDAIRTPSIERLLKPQAKGYDLPFSALNKEIRGIKPGRIYTICAGEGCGKSSFTKEILFSLINTYKDLKVGAIYLEEPIETTANSFTAIDNNVPLWQLEEDQEALNLLTPKTYDKFIKNHRIEFVDASFMELDGKELEYNIRWLAEGLDCPVIVLDHLTMVTYDMGHDSSERKDIDILMKGLRRLTKETNCSILNVCHLKRPSGKEGWDQGREISLTDLRGSAAIGQLSDVVIGLERNLQNESLKNKTLIKVLKNRIKGSTGHIDTLYYDELTGRLITVDQLFK